MDNRSKFILAKFGKKEHLEQLKEGNIFFNAIQTYRDDGTDYRGDKMEGRIPIDPTKIKIYDEEGNDIFEKLPYPYSVIESFIGDEKLMMFCASVINIEFMDHIKDDRWTFKEEFKLAVQNFGDYVLILRSADILDHIEAARDCKGQRIGRSSGRILYRDMTDFENTNAYRETGSWLDRYFVKGLDYKNQNEWRVIIDGEKESLEANCGTGILLHTYPFHDSQIMKTTDFLNDEITITD